MIMNGKIKGVVVIHKAVSISSFLFEKKLLISSFLFEKKVCGVPMIEMIGMRICCYILLAVMIVRILGD